MIVRVFTQGQFEISDDVVDTLNDIDNRLTDAVEKGNEAEFRAALSEIHDVVAAKGTPLTDDVIRESDAVLPDLDSSIEEVRELLNEDGLIPG